MHKANTLKTAVACALLGATAISAAVSSAHAEPEYDTKLAKFLADKAADQLGGLRDGYAIDGAPDAATSDDMAPYNAGEAMAPLTGSVDGTTTASIQPPVSFIMPRTDIRVVYAG